MSKQHQTLFVKLKLVQRKVESMNTLRKSQLKKLIKEEFQAQSHDFNTMEANKLLNNIQYFSQSSPLSVLC